jgi:hypothetical protein
MANSLPLTKLLEYLTKAKEPVLLKYHGLIFAMVINGIF